MKVAKQSNFLRLKEVNDFEKYIKALDSDLFSLFTALQGRIRLGSATNLGLGENLSGQYLLLTSPTTSGFQFSSTHYLSTTPQGWVVLSQDQAGSIYAGSTANNATTVYFRSSATSTNYTIFLIK